jgi:hypothetical protein
LVALDDSAGSEKTEESAALFPNQREAICRNGGFAPAGISEARRRYDIRGQRGLTPTADKSPFPKTSSSRGFKMNIARTTISLVLLAALGTAAQAQSEVTREQVKAELADAIRTGDILAPGDSGMKLNELYPQRYPRPAAGPTVTRAQVKAELAEAMRTGDMLADGDSGLKLNEEFPQRYPAVVAAPRKTRAEVRAELAEAIRTGDMLAAGDSGIKLNEEFPQRYANVRASQERQQQASVAMAASAVAR